MADNQEDLANNQNGDRTKLDRVKEKVKPGARITLIISLIFALIALIVGIYGVKKCPVEENIPFFVIVIGAVGLLSKACSIVKDSLRDRVREFTKIEFTESSLYTIEFVFFILGSYWVFKEYKPSFDPNSFPDQYCNKTVYMFAFVYLIVIYAMLFLVVTCYCCFLACMFFVVSTADRAEINNESVSRPIHSEQT